MKKLNKKLMALCLSMVVCAASLSGCGVSGDTTDAEVQEETQKDSVGEVTTFPLPDSSQEADIYVEPISDLADDFIRGMDASAVLALENSGVTYYNYEGEEQDVFMTLAQSGVNYIRLRVWNDPYDENGNGYGGGNNDVATAIELGKRATRYGMKVSIDFHYSDFWADPMKQYAPKAWEGMSLEEKCTALSDFTKESLTEILDAGVDVGMVQIGNEINNGMSGETDRQSVMELLSAGSSAVREVAETYEKDIQVAVHFTNIENIDEINAIASDLETFGLDYDRFGLSYYSFWHGTIENMQNVVKMIREGYGKDVFIAETSYCYTSEDGDGFSNSVAGTDDLVEGYAATVQSQATMVRDICAAASDAGALGVFYWEGTWIPVGDATADNSSKWEKYGSGWASSYSAGYDPDDAGQYYGGCSWDNQAMFDFDGHPLASLNVFKYLKYGATAPLAIDYIPELSISCEVGGEIELPEKIDVVYNDRSASEQCAVTWDEMQVAAINTNEGGTYEVTGSVADGGTVTCRVEVQRTNYVQNPSFEDADTSMWKVSYVGDEDPTDYQVKAADAYSGDVAFHFWTEAADMDFAIEQEFTDLEPGTYELAVFAQGGDISGDAAMELYAITGDGEQTQDFMMNGYANWQNPVIPTVEVTDGTLTIGVRIKCGPKSWGTVDDFALYRID